MCVCDRFEDECWSEYFFEQLNVHRYSFFVDSRVFEDVSPLLKQIVSADAVIRPTYIDKEVDDDDIFEID